MTSLSSKGPRRFACYKCPYESCTKSFNRPCRLAEHIRSHTNERPYVCKEAGCDKSFRRDTHLARHVKQAHSDERNYPCTWEGCDKKFATSQRLKRHIETHESKFYCTGYAPCTEWFRKHSTLQAHIDAVHLNRKPYPCSHVDQETGQQCTHSYDSANALRLHTIRAHQGERYLCTICAEAASPSGGGTRSADAIGFSSYNALQTHIREAHPPTCDVCALAFQTKPELRRHIDLCHSDTPTSLDDRRIYSCEHPGCGKAFTKRGNLNVHMQTVHKNLRQFVCGQVDLSNSRTPELANWGGQDACGATYKTKANLEDHIRTKHFGMGTVQNEKKKAKEDGQDVAQPKKNGKAKPKPSVLSRLTGVGYEQDRDIACLLDNCPFRFMREYDLRAHVSTVHGLSEEDISEALLERSALAGGQFWLGGMDPDSEPYESGISRGQGYEGYDEYEQEASWQLDQQMGFDPVDPSLESAGNADLAAGGQQGPGLDGDVQMMDAVLDFLHAER
jgi:general transcription factor IIIA